MSVRRNNLDPQDIQDFEINSPDGVYGRKSGRTSRNQNKVRTSMDVADMSTIEQKQGGDSLRRGKHNKSLQTGKFNIYNEDSEINTLSDNSLGRDMKEIPSHILGAPAPRNHTLSVNNKGHNSL